jgi:hypothetical protein
VTDRPKAAPPSVGTRAPEPVPSIERPDDAVSTPPPSNVPSNQPTGMPAPIVRPRKAIGPFICITAAIGIAGFILYRVLRGVARPSCNDGTTPPPGFPVAGRPGAAPGGGSGAGVRIGDDGFWLLLDNAALGSRVHYGYRLPGAGGEAAGSVLYQPGVEGQFVYTGAAPQYARVTRVDPPGADATWDAGATGVATTMFDATPPPLRSTTRETREREPDRPPRYPSAY